MTDAPEKIWAKEGHDSWGQYGDWYRDKKGGGTEYTRIDVSDARIAELEAALLVADKFLTNLQESGSEPLNSINGGNKSARNYFTAQLRNDARVVWAVVGNALQAKS